MCPNFLPKNNRHYRVDAKQPDHEYTQTSPYLQRRALRLASSPKQKHFLNVESAGNLSNVAVHLNFPASPKKVKKHKHQYYRNKCGRSHSITTHTPDIEKLKEKISKRNCELNLDPNRNNQKLEVSDESGGGGAVSKSPSKNPNLPRTLSTSVLRIKHRRTFWERVTR